MDFLGNQANMSEPVRFQLNILLWNCRGLANREAKCTIHGLVYAHQPDIFIVTETRMHRDKIGRIADRLPFDAWEASETIGHRGGILLLWDPNKVMMDIRGTTEQEIHAMVGVRNSNFSFLLSALYASPRFRERKILWENLELIAGSHNLPWLAYGDFNEVLSNSEKLGGGPVSLSKSLRFSEMLDKCSFSDLGFSGPKFTWTNLRYSGYLIQERLDRAVANNSWSQSFPNAKVIHLPRIHSDHCPLLLKCNPFQQRSSNRPFRLELMWMSHPSFKNLISEAWAERDICLETSMKRFSIKVKDWNRDVFGNVFQRKKRVMARLNGIQKSLAMNPSNFLISLEKDLRLEYSQILNQERDLWRMKSRSNWLQDGDRNTRFFHVSTLVNRRKNKIFALKNSVGEWFCLHH